jgi:hypothetical protein
MKTFREHLNSTTYKAIFNEIYKKYLKNIHTDSEITEIEINFSKHMDLLQDIEIENPVTEHPEDTEVSEVIDDSDIQVHDIHEKCKPDPNVENYIHIHLKDDQVVVDIDRGDECCEVHCLPLELYLDCEVKCDLELTDAEICAHAIHQSLT